MRPLDPCGVLLALLIFPAASPPAAAQGAPPSAAVEESGRRLLADYRAGRVLAPEELVAVAGALVDLGRENPQHFHEALRLYDAAIAARPENLDYQIMLGDLLLSKYNGQDAREAYESVLRQDPEHARALLGLARVERFDGATDVFELTQKSLEQDPHLVAARLLQARQHIDLEAYSKADEEARKALASDPSSAQAHVLLAASALLAGDETEFERHLARAREIAPADAEIYVTLAEIAARNRLYRRAVDFADRAVRTDGMSWRGYALRGVNRLRIGDIDTGRGDLETAFGGDPFDVWTKNTLDLLDAMAEYQVVATERFQLVMPAEEAEALALYLEPLAEEAYDRLAAHYGIELPTPVRVEVFARHADFSVRTVGLVGLGALGVSFGPVVAMDSPSARPAGDFHWGTTFWHELAHSFHLQLSDFRVPRWFTEGLAVFEERRARPGWGDRISPEYLLAYREDRLAPVDDLNQGFMRPSYPQQIVFSYYQASLVFDFIVEKWSFAAVVAMLEGYRDRKSTPEIFKEVLGLDPKLFAQDFDRYFRERFAGPLSALRSVENGEQDFVKRADQDPQDFLAHLAAGQKLLEKDPEAAFSYLTRAKSLFPSYTGDESPYWLLAQLHQRAGDPKAALAELDALTTRNRAHYPALRAQAELAVQLGEAKKAAAALAQAQFIFPYEGEDHRQLAEMFEAQKELESAVRERRAVVALRPFNLAEALFRLAVSEHEAGDSKAARSTLLEALELAPNHEEALELLLELRSRHDAP